MESFLDSGRIFVFWNGMAATKHTSAPCYCGHHFSDWNVLQHVDFQRLAKLLAHVEHSLTRLLVQVTPVAWLAIALALRATEPKQQATKISS